MTTAFAPSLSKGITIATVLKQTPSHQLETDACADAGTEGDAEAAAEAGEPVVDAEAGVAAAETEDRDEADCERSVSVVAAAAVAR